MPRWILIPLAVSAAALFAALGVLMATEKRVAAGAPDFRVVRTGGLEYEAMQGRPLHPGNAVDRQIVAGLQADKRRALLFGAFISVTNDSSRALPTAKRIELRDESGHVYHPLPLPASNAYAYRPRLIRPGTRIPGRATPADENLAATGVLLVFRIPAPAYAAGALELVIHDPVRPTHTASLLL
jgi:hypothetical protein